MSVSGTGRPSPPATLKINNDQEIKKKEFMDEVCDEWCTHFCTLNIPLAIRSLRVGNRYFFSAGPWTIFAPTNDAFMNLPMDELEDLIKSSKKLKRLLLNHLINKSLFSAGLRSHQIVEMAGGARLNLFRRKGTYRVFRNQWYSTCIS